MPPFLQNILALPAKTKAILAVSAVAILGIAFIMLKIATAPAYSTIASGLDPAQTGKITAAMRKELEPKKAAQEAKDTLDDWLTE